MGETPERGLVGKQRIEALSDGLYAIAMTLLVLDLKVPSLSADASNAELTGALSALVPRAVTWMLSFWVMGLMWLGQVRAYRLVHSVSWTMLRVQLLALAAISLMPFSTALLSEHGHQPTAAVTYSANLVAIAVLGLVHTRLLVNDARLHAHELSATARSRILVRSDMMLACSTASLVLGYFVPMWNLLPMVLLLLRPGEEESA